MNTKAPIYHLDVNYTKEPLELGGVSLVQIGRRFCNPGETVPTHTHLDWFEITLCLEGEATVRANDTASTITKGDIHLSFPCEIHGINAGERGFEYDFFAFECRDGSLRARLYDVMRDASLYSKRVFHSENVAFFVKNAIYELASEGRYDGSVLSRLVELCVEYIIRDFEPCDAERRGERGELICYRIMNYIDTGIYTLSGTSEIADKFGYNRNYLSTLFKRVTGKTMFEYYSERRYELARVLLIEGELKIREIAERLNYSSAFAFTKAFTARYGISPKKMRENFKDFNKGT